MVNIVNPDNLKPVIVLVTGVFTSKSIYNYESFLKNDVIFVNIHYRTGILGKCKNKNNLSMTRVNF